jgi:hypothetical protein
MKDKRTDHDLLISIEEKVIQYGKDIDTLKSYFDNHLTEHKEDLKEKLRRHWTLMLLMISIGATSLSGLIVGLISLFG